MKKLTLSILLLATVFSFAPSSQTKAQSVAVSFSVFQQELSPYGRWVNSPRFGQVWINNDINFRPYYTDGHWEYTNYGWAWVSDYDWGWAPFHYGRWEEDPNYGWMWIPGYEWAPAWVSWSSYGDYYGWAPLGYGLSINISFGSIPYNRWTFIPRRNICDRDINRYYVSHGRNNNFRNAVVINNYYNGNGRVGRYYRGPQRREAERYTGNRIQERRIDYNDRRRNRADNDGRANAGNGNNRRNDDRVRRDANNNSSDNGNNRRNSNVNRENNNNNGSANENKPRRRFDSPNADNATPPARENRKPDREVRRLPQRSENNTSERRNTDNRQYRGNNQQNDNRQERRIERPAREQQQRQPATEQRRMERRDDGNRNIQRSNDNNQRRQSNNGKRRNGG